MTVELCVEAGIIFGSALSPHFDIEAAQQNENALQLNFSTGRCVDAGLQSSSARKGRQVS